MQIKIILSTVNREPVREKYKKTILSTMNRKPVNP